MAERTEQEVAELYASIQHASTELMTNCGQPEITNELKTKIQEGVETIETIKNYKKEDGETSIWTTEDFSIIDVNITFAKTLY